MDVCDRALQEDNSMTAALVAGFPCQPQLASRAAWAFARNGWHGQAAVFVSQV